MRSRRTSTCRPTFCPNAAAAVACADEAADEPAVVAAIRADPMLTARERQALLEVYSAFVERRRPTR